VGWYRAAWFPDKGRIAAIALRICAACPVRAECLDYALSGADTWGDQYRHLGRHHTARARGDKAVAGGQGGGMTSVTRARRRQRARAARVAPALCEADQPARPRINGASARAALRAAGLPPQLAARLRRRIRLALQQEAKP